MAKKSMQAITYSQYGGPEVLQLEQVQTPCIGDDEVLIRVRAAEATKADCELRAFKFSVRWFWLPLRLTLGVFRPRRRILGGYLAGEVVEVGNNVTRLARGDQVFGSTKMRFGGYGQYVALPASYCLVPKPNNMSFDEAAAVPLGGLNALHFMRLAKIQPEERVLILGAGGSIGAHAVQIAKDLGAKVTGVDIGYKRDFVLKLGASDFIDYTLEDFARRKKRYDIIFDMVPSSSFRACMSCLKENGRYFCGNPRLSVMLRCFLTQRFTSKVASFAFAQESQAELTELKTMIEAGRITPIVDRIFSMSQAQQAHQRVESEQRVGAVILHID